jgi:hypothetical protein
MNGVFRTPCKISRIYTMIESESVKDLTCIMVNTVIAKQMLPMAIHCGKHGVKLTVIVGDYNAMSLVVDGVTLMQDLDISIPELSVMMELIGDHSIHQVNSRAKHLSYCYDNDIHFVPIRQFKHIYERN